MPVELRLIDAFGYAVEVGKEIELLGLCRLVFFGLPEQIVDQHLGVHLFLDIEGWCLHHQLGPVLLILAAPDQLRVQVAVARLLFLRQFGAAARIAHLDRYLIVFPHHRLVFGGGDVFTGGLFVGEGFDGQLGIVFLGHNYLPVK